MQTPRITSVTKSDCVTSWLQSSDGCPLLLEIKLKRFITLHDAFQKRAPGPSPTHPPWAPRTAGFFLLPDCTPLRQAGPWRQLLPLPNSTTVSSQRAPWSSSQLNVNSSREPPHLFALFHVPLPPSHTPVVRLPFLHRRFRYLRRPGLRAILLANTASAPKGHEGARLAANASTRSRACPQHLAGARQHRLNERL